MQHAQARLISTVAIMTLSPLGCWANDIDITGKLWYKVLDAGSNVIFESDLNYHAELSQTGWRITTQPATTNDSEAVLFHQVGTDGKSIYSLSCLNTNSTLSSTELTGFQLPSKNKKPRSSNLVPRNGAVAEIYDGIVPRGDHTFAAPIWLAYASCDYINSATNGRMRKIWLDGQRYNTNDVKIDLRRWPDPPNAIQTLTFLNEGYRVVELANSTIQIIPLQPPYNKGYKEVVYSVDSVTNLGSLQLPRRFSLVKYTPIANATSSSDLRVLATIEAVAESIEEVPGGGRDIRVTIPTTTAVFDNRSEGLSYGARGVSYLLKTSSRMSREDLASVRSMAISNANQAGRRILAQRGNSGGQLRRLMFIAFAATTGLAAMLILSRQGRRKVSRSP